MSLLAIKDAACTKKTLDPANFVLEYKGKRMDLSLSVRFILIIFIILFLFLRFAGIPNNATVELVELEEGERREDGEVVVCLQLPSGERRVTNFTPSATLAEVVGEEGAGAGEGEQRVVVYMRQEVVGEEELKAMTLRRLGLTSGKCLLRLTSKVRPHLTSEEAPQ